MNKIYVACINYIGKNQTNTLNNQYFQTEAEAIQAACEYMIKWEGFHNYHLGGSLAFEKAFEELNLAAKACDWDLVKKLYMYWYWFPKIIALELAPSNLIIE